MYKGNVGTIILDLTNDCMLRCEYCYVNGGEFNDELSVENSLIAIKEFAKLFNHVNVLFHGGEPLLCYKNMCSIIEETEKTDLDCKLSYFIQTNGVLVDQNKCEYFKEHNVGVCISIDGFDNKSNYARRDCFAKASCTKSVEAIKLLRVYEIDISLLSVLTEYNKNSVDLYLEKTEEFGISSFAFNPMTQAGRGHKNHDLSVSAKEVYDIYKKILLWMLRKAEMGKFPVERNIMYMLDKIFENRTQFMCMNSPCGAGLSLWAVTATDEIYPCADFVSSPEFCIGKIQNGKIEKVSFETLESLYSVRLDVVEKCKKCEYKRYCPSGCSAKKYYHNGNVHAMDPLCKVYKLFIDYVICGDEKGKIKDFYYKVKKSSLRCNEK